MGKVASSSIYHALKSRDDCFAFHTHLLSKDKFTRRRTKSKDRLFAPDKRLRTSKLLSEHIIEPKHPVKIITLVRDPFARNISAFFENEPATKASYSDKNQFVSNLMKQFLSESTHKVPINWYIKEFKSALGVDIYSHRFDTDKKWAHFREANYDILTLRTELDDRTKNIVVSNFLGVDDLRIGRSNQTENKGINPVYQAFKERVRFPEMIAEPLLDSQYCQHFFTAEERDAMRQNWVEK